ncbi:MAG: hypothetical protein PHT12_05165 [Patescibacteria group bacterium]|nr:hypothetical protein [Patescibacteria group bacterium]
MSSDGFSPVAKPETNLTEDIKSFSEAPDWQEYLRGAANQQLASDVPTALVSLLRSLAKCSLCSDEFEWRPWQDADGDFILAAFNHLGGQAREIIPARISDIPPITKPPWAADDCYGPEEMLGGLHRGIWRCLFTSLQCQEAGAYSVISGAAGDSRGQGGDIALSVLDYADEVSRLVKNDQARGELGMMPEGLRHVIGVNIHWLVIAYARFAHLGDVNKARACRLLLNEYGRGHWLTDYRRPVAEGKLFVICG